MLEQLARHSLIDIALEAKGDLHVDMHHTTEDSGIVLGQAVAQALGAREGIARYGAALLPMDEALTRVALDISGRPYLVWNVAFDRPKIGDMDTELFREWFQAFAQNAGLTLHVDSLAGENNHHIVETCFKGLARALRQAVAIDARQKGRVPSTKGSLSGCRRRTRSAMRVYTVHEPPVMPDRPPPSLLERAESLVFVKEGFSWPAFLFSPLWLIWHRMWHVLAIWAAAFILSQGLIAALGLGDAIAGWAALTLDLILGFEGGELRRWTLDRKGWRLLGAVSGRRLDECERAFFADWLPSARASRARPTGPAPA